MQLHVDAVEPRADAPILLHFQNGYVAKGFSKANPAGVLLSGEGRTVVAAQIGETLYAGEETHDELGKTLLLVRSQKTGKVRVLEAGTASLRAVVSLDARPAAAEATALDVSRTFGSKRDRQAMEQRERLRVDHQTMHQQLKKVAEDITAEKIDLKDFTKTDSEDFYIPPINRDADNVADVYRITDILTEEQIDNINGEIESKDWQNELSPYFKGMVKKNMNATERALLLYANTMLKMVSVLLKDIVKKSFVACEVSHTVNDVCCDTFTSVVNGRRSRPNQLKDKTLCHLIVVVLLLNNFKFNLEEFSKAVKISMTTLVMKTRAVGAHLSTNKKTVSLKLPLNTAKSFLARRKSAKF